MTIEDGACIGLHTCFTNDLYPSSVGDDCELLTEALWRLVPTRVGRRASIGANATILCGVTIGEGAMVAAGSVVTRDVSPHTLVARVPAKVIGTRPTGPVPFGGPGHVS